MKRFKLCLIIALILCVLPLCCACGGGAHNIDKNDVTEIRFLRQNSDWTEEETETFIKLFNEAEYMGDERIGDTTPEYMVFVYYEDGTYLQVNQFCLKHYYEVNEHKDGKGTSYRYYKRSAELEEFILQLIDKYCG